ncbi:MAG: DUF922 domain-containing protein [Rhizobiaceae bacterium]
MNTDIAADKGLGRFRPAFACLVALAASTANAQDWQPSEQVKPYAISGSTGPELYEAIGEKGPLIGATRAIAITTWDLKWRRDYRPDGTSCVLKSAIPFLTITYRLPKPAAKPRGATAKNWETFANGIAAHEKVHGRDIMSMVNQIIAATVGLRVDNDPDCKAIRAEVLKQVEAANEAYKAKSRAFDQIEMSKDGAIQKLILALVNGG